MVDEDLEPLITRCPNCSTQFRVTENQLAAAGGRVRCGACLTVFEGTEHLILDEDSAFSDGLDADAALDALLDELGTSERADAETSTAELEQPAEAPALTQDTPVIYGGFEDEPAFAEANEAAADEEVAAEAEVSAGAEAATESYVEADAAAESGSEDGADAGTEPLAGEEAVAEPPAASEQAATQAEAQPDSETGAELEDDYRAWIRPGTPDIEQLVDEVVASGAALPETEAPDAEALAAAAAQAASTAEGGFHLSAVEKSLEEEGVGTSPISFAPEPRRWWVVGAATGLTLLLAAQVFYLQLPEWSRDPGTRGFYEGVCGLLGCELPEIRALDSLRTRNLMVRSHPELEDALVIDAVIVNQASFPQRFPGLQLRFTSVGGLLVAGRTFQPDEYLGGEISAADLMPVNTPVQISLEISDPGAEAVNYTLSFR